MRKHYVMFVLGGSQAAYGANWMEVDSKLLSADSVGRTDESFVARFSSAAIQYWSNKPMNEVRHEYK